MATQILISNTNQQNAYGNNIAQNQAVKKGNHQGQAIWQSKKPDIDDINRQKYNEMLRTGEGFRMQQPIAQRIIQIDHQRSIRPYDQIVNHSRKTKDAEGSTKLARQLLESLSTSSQAPKIPNQGASRKEVMQYFLALQKLGKALQSSDEDFAALLTDNTEHASTLNEFARHLQERDDEEKVSSFLEGGKAFAEKSDNLFQLFKQARFNNTQLESLLREAQGLPHLKADEKRELLDKVTTQIHILEQEHGKKINAGLNYLSAAEKTTDTDKFLDSVSDVFHSETLESQIAALCKNYNFKELSRVLPEMKQALAEDLDSQYRSLDKVKLQHIITNMSILHTAQTALIKVINISADMMRIFQNKMNEKDLLLSLIKLVTSSTASPSQIEKLSTDHHVKPVSAMIYFFTHVIKGFVNEFPTKFFPDLEARKAILTAIDHVINDLVEQEEENLDQSSLNNPLILG